MTETETSWVPSLWRQTRQRQLAELQALRDQDGTPDPYLDWLIVILRAPAAPEAKLP